jgi:hypothetical protein
MTEVTLLRRGAVVRIPSTALGPELPVLGITFVDLQFDDGHVERWFGPGVLGSAPEDPDMEIVVEWALDDVADGEAEALLSELADDGLEIPAGALARTPVEIVFEWNVPLPAELSLACRGPREA